MTKDQAKEVFGVSTLTALAAHLGVTKGCVSQWPDDELTDLQAGRVIAAAIRQGKNVPKAWLKAPRTAA